jgi:pilus assembly protein Flp/PilA
VKNFLKVMASPLKKFARDEEGAQVVEYALIIAVVSIALVLALQGLSGGSFATFIARLNTCLSATCV